VLRWFRLNPSAWRPDCPRRTKRLAVLSSLLSGSKPQNSFKCCSDRLLICCWFVSCRHLEEIASFLPGAPFSKLQVNFKQGRLTIQDTFALPQLPLGFGYVTDVALILGAAIQLSPQSLDFTAGIGSEQKPFHWLVNPLSGTGVVQVGVRNGDLAILIEAGLGAGLAIDLAIASGSASVIIAIQINNELAPFQIKAILTGQASVDVLDGLASASISLSAALGISPDKLPIPDSLRHPPGGTALGHRRIWCSIAMTRTNYRSCGIAPR